MNKQIFATNSLSSNTYAIVADRVWDGTSATSTKNLAVIINGEIIQDVVPLNMLPADMNTVNLPDCTLLPGLIDAHVHYSSVTVSYTHLRAHET